MTAWYRRMGILLLATLVTACSGGDNGETRSSESGQASQATRSSETMAESPEVETEGFEPMQAPVEIDFTALLLDDRRLMVEGESNLPPGAQLEVIVERELSGVRWRSRTDMGEGRFSAGPFGPGSGLADGGYRISVQISEAAVQPKAVRQRIGEQGEHLSGPLVSTSRHGLGKVASFAQRFMVGDEPRRTHDQVNVVEMEE